MMLEVSTRGICPGASISPLYKLGTFRHLVNGFEGKKNYILSGPLPQASLSSLSYTLFLSCAFFLLPSLFFLAWCLKLTWSSFFSTLFTPAGSLTLNISDRTLLATAGILSRSGNADALLQDHVNTACLDYTQQGHMIMASDPNFQATED